MKHGVFSAAAHGCTGSHCNYTAQLSGVNVMQHDGTQLLLSWHSLENK